MPVGVLNILKFNVIIYSEKATEKEINMETISAFLVDKLLKRNIILEEKAPICKNGIMLILADIINFSLILIIGLFTKSLFESVMYLTVFWIVRRFSGGFHAKTYWLCRIVTVGTYMTIFLVSKIINDYYIIITLICDIFAVITMIVFAPIRHPNKELTNKEVKANKLFALLTTLFFTLLSIVLSVFNRKEGLVISLILFAISVLMYIGLLTNGNEGKDNVKNH